MKHNQTMSKNAVRGIINHLSSHTVRHSKQNATQHKSCQITMLQLMRRAVAICVMVMMCGVVWGQTNANSNANSRPSTFYTSINDIRTGQPFAIVNRNEGKALYGSTNQNIAYADYATAFAFGNAVTQYKLEAVTDGNYLLRCVTPTGGGYGLWGSNLCYFNAQENIGGVTFNLGLGENNQNGQDMANGAVWTLNYDVSENGWTLRCVGNNGYAAPNGVTQKEPYYWQFCSLTYTPHTNAISNSNMIYAYKIQNQKDNSYYFVADGSKLNSYLKTSNVNSVTNASTAYWYFIPNGNNGYSIMQLVSGYGVHYPDMDTGKSVDDTNGNNSNRGQITLTATPSAFRFNDNGFILHGVADWDLEPDSRNGANLNLWLNTSLDNTLGRWNYVSEQGIPSQKVFSDFSITGADVITTAGTQQYNPNTDVYYSEYFQFTLGDTTYYKVGNAAATTAAPQGTKITDFEWSLSGNAAGHATVSNAGVITYSTYFEVDTDVTLTLKAKNAGFNYKEVNKTIKFEAPKENPTKVEAVSPMTVYVGKTGKISYTLTPNPCYENVTYESSNTSVATVAADGTVSGVTAGDAEITLKAHLYNSTEFVSTTVTVNVKHQVATPVISFKPNGATATATISCVTSGATIYYTTNGDTPTSESTPYTTPFTVNAFDVVKAIAITDQTGWDNSEIASLQYTLETVPTPTINVRGYEVTFTCDEPGVTYYYTTDGSEPSTTHGTEWNGSTITSSAGTTIKVIANKSGFSPSEVASTTLSAAHVVYLRLAGAQGSSDGSSAANAVGSWSDAFAKLGYGPNAKYLREQWANHGSDANTRNLAYNAVFNNATYTSTVDNNIIYLVGDVSESDFYTLMGKTIASASSEYDLMNPIVESGFFKPVTISGKYANSTTSSTGYARISLNAGSKYTLNEDMRFEYVEFYGNGNVNSTDFQMAYYDLEMGEGITCKNFVSTKEFNTYHHGYKQGVTNTAHILFYGGLTCDSRFGTDPNGALNFDYFLPHPSGYKITIRSGFFSTISPGSTQWDGGNTLNGTMGSPNTPVKCTITVDIDRKWNDDHQTEVLVNGTSPDCDVAVVIAGVHEGNIYGDVDIIVKSGRIDRIVNGTFGANNFVDNHPADSYFGRANILIDPREPSTAERATYPTKNSLVVVRELYGGGLGRFKGTDNTTSQSSTYFYGKSTVTINGGTFLSAIYASGAGGVNGVGDANHHTPDAMLPYMDGGSIKYGNYAAYSSHDKLVVKFHKARNVYEPDFHTDDATIESSLTIDQTNAKVEIHGGVFGSEGSPIVGIFGGGYGFVDQELIHYESGVKPNIRAGAIFAPAGQLASSVLIDGDAEIYGNVYGAGRGSDTYKNASLIFNDDDYTQLGQVAGNVELTIGGNAKIHGSVYGAGLGISGLTNMARLYGNTTLTVKENAVITVGVYGGGENGIVDQNGSGYGNTTVNIIGGTIGSSSYPQNVHGGGLGSQTRVMGSVNLTVGEANATTGATIYGDVYGGSAQGKTNGNTSLTSGATTTVTLNAGTINGSLYGGGLGTSANPADVYGPVAVKVYGGSVQTTDGTGANGSGAVYGCNNINGKPQRAVTVDIYGTDSHDAGSKATDPSDDKYAIYAVYGGGNQAAYTFGTPAVTIHNCDNSIEYVYGGGNQATVPGTKVDVYGGYIIGTVFGGGNNANVTTNGTDVNIYGGRILNVYGGNNNGGTITGSIKVNVAEPSTVACAVNIDDLYGGGNLAASNAGTITIGKCTNINRVFGGANQANVTGPINLSIVNGNIGTVFGGNNNSGTITGAITVTVNWDGTGNRSLGSVYGGGNLAEYKGNPTVNILNCTTTGSIFGGGLGVVKDADGEITKGAFVVGNPVVTIGDWTSSHHVEIGGNVFGGGDLAAVEGNPAVTVNDCGTLIKGDLYGGGNAAPVYSTNLTMWGGTVMGNVFGGGNGNDLTKNENGAQIGYKRDDTTTDGAGTGNAVAKIFGGTVGTWNGDECTAGGGIFGGSNTKGDVRGEVQLTIDQQKCEDAASACDLKVKEIYGAGNEAVYAGTGIKFNLGCVSAMSEIYGGAKKADLSGDVHLIISSGHFNKVFAGNNLGGSINGSIKVTIEETGCNPVIIDELYGGGNMAAYTTPSGKAQPEVNVISCTSIGKVFGGGYGKTAVVTGNTHVNINMIKGAFSGNITNRWGNKLGTIGEVYGGGNAANVNGDTYVNIGTLEKVTSVSGSTEGNEIVTEGANISGNVYGGGNAADVTGKTNVTVGRQK